MGGGTERAEVLVVGAGIVGLATALALSRRDGPRPTVVEAEPGVARHQTGHNSGVLHAGVYYKPGSAKATHCRRGREALVRFCADRGIRHEICGKLVVATDDREAARLEVLRTRAEANGLSGVTVLDRAGMRRVEPAVGGIRGLFVPQTGIVDYREVAAAYAAEIAARGGRVLTGWRVRAVDADGPGHRVATSAGELSAPFLVNCAGLRSDQVARLCGETPSVRIVPFRGEYRRLAPGRRGLCRNLIYPVPDPALPFLGVHLTRGVDGEVEAGPNAVLALSREGYRWRDVSAADVAGTLAFPGFRRLVARWWRTGVAEVARSWSPGQFARSLARLVPGLVQADLSPGGAGVRAQAVDLSGRLVDDFVVLDGRRALHVLNAPSPAATASLSLGEEIASRVAARLCA